MICNYYNTTRFWWFVFLILRIFDDLYLLQYYKILMICFYNTKNYRWFVFLKLKIIDDLYLL